MSVSGQHAYRFGYLKSEAWKNVRAEVLARDDARCFLCRTRDLSNDVHHHRYPPNFWDTTRKDCITLCRKCHDWIHLFFEKRIDWQLLKMLRRYGNPTKLLTIFALCIKYRIVLQKIPGGTART